MQIMNKLLFVCLLVGLQSCGEEKKEVQTPIPALKEIGKLATAEYIITKVVRARDNKTWYKIGDRKILISCKASIKAGIDLTQLKENDFSRTEQSITIKLPQPQLISFNMAPENIKVEYTEVGFFRSDFSNTDIEDIMQQAEAQIRGQIDRMGILASARNNASRFVHNFLITAGYENVSVQF